MDNNALYHHGVKGMKWGVRRYQNADGTLTNSGKKRMYREMYDLEGGKERRKYKADAHKWVKDDLVNSKKVVDELGNATNRIKNISDRKSKNASRPVIDLSHMTDQELRQAINRSMMERQYSDLCVPANISKGRERTKRFLETAGDVLAVGGSALGIALSVKQLRG